MLFRNLFIIVLISAMLTSVLIAEEWEVYFEQGNKAYAEGRYQEAIDFYNKILNNNVESGEVYFNLGNSYYKLNEIGESILYYEKGRQYLEHDEGLQKNLQIVQLKAIDKIEPVPKFFLEVWWMMALHIFSLETLAWITLGTGIMLSLIVSLVIIFPGKVLMKFVLIFSILFIFSVVFFSSRIYEFETNKFGVILEQKISIKTEPSLEASELFVLHEGTKVKLNRSVDDWYEISLADGKTGWCKIQAVGEI